MSISKILTRRLFIALPIGNDAVQPLSAIQTRLKTYGGGNFPPAKNFHITLAFLGDVREDQIDELVSLLSKIKFRSMSLRCSKMEYFHSDKNWHASVDDNAELSHLKEQIMLLLSAGHFCADQTEFHPHITLCRKLQGEFNAQEIFGESFDFRIECFCLFQSEFTPHGMKYVPIATFR